MAPLRQNRQHIRPVTIAQPVTVQGMSMLVELSMLNHIRTVTVTGPHVSGTLTLYISVPSQSQVLYNIWGPLILVLSVARLLSTLQRQCNQHADSNTVTALYYSFNKRYRTEPLPDLSPTLHLLFKAGLSNTAR